jgi:uncharacterized OB-fold protein
MVKASILTDRYGAEGDLWQVLLGFLSNGELRVQRCAECGYLRWPPTRACNECWSLEYDWTPVGPSGVIWSVAEYERTYSDSHPAPYNVGLIDLDDGVTLLLNVEHGSVALAPGQQVELIFREGEGLQKIGCRLTDFPDALIAK